MINSSHKMYKICDELCFKSKNVYNYANYIIRQEFINNGKWIRYRDLSKQIKHSDCFKDLGSNSSQMTLRILDKTWKSFFKAIKDWKVNPSKYLGRPKIPKYKNKDGRFACTLTNMQTHIKDNYLYFAYSPLKPYNNLFKTNIDIKGRLLQTRIIPKGGCYILEIVYEKEIEELNDNMVSNRIISIDLGLNNFATITNNIGLKPIVINGKGIKSYNQYWNKKIAYYRSIAKITNKLDWTRRLARLTDKRNNKIDYFMHCSSKYIIDYCIENNIDTVVVGKNEGWKQDCDMGRITQGFVQIPYESFIDKLKYKCEDCGIKFIENEESYTSKASFLDSDIIPKFKKNDNQFYEFSGKRIKRGLYQSKENILINADVNGAYNIMRKVFPNIIIIINGIVGVHLHPIIINMA